jgi:hypothetical protein
MATADGDLPDTQRNATMAELEAADTELEFFKLSGHVDDTLLDASLDQYQY